MNSYITKSKTGRRILHVFYDNKARDWDEQTEIALKKHGLPENNKMNIICLPDHSKKMPLFSHESS